LRPNALVPALVVAVALPHPVLAESAADSLARDGVETVLRRGDVVRLEYRDTKQRAVRGTVDQLDQTSGILKTSDEDATIPLSQITRVKRRVGSHGNFGPGAALGGIIGGVGLAALVVAFSNAELGYVPGEDIATGFLMGAGVGIAVGGLLGATAFRSDMWQEVPAAEWRR
jgi:hypothetical protein